MRLEHYRQLNGLLAGIAQLDEEQRRALARVTHSRQLTRHGSVAADAYGPKRGPEQFAALASWPGVAALAPRAPVRFNFIDLFAGIGGMRLAAQNLGGLCVFSSEWDSHAQLTYYANHAEMPFGDIKPIARRAATAIPDHDVLFAGFPCQAFSIAGHRRGLDDTRGTLYREVVRVIEAKTPAVVVLENVKGLVGHDRGTTLRTILRTLREDLKYGVPEPQVLNACDFDLPQNRERVVIVAFRDSKALDHFSYPTRLSHKKRLRDILSEDTVSAKYYLSTQYLHALKQHRARHESKGHGFGYVVLDLDDIAGAIVCGGMGRERNLVRDERLENFTPVTNIKGEVNREGIRRMTPREWARLQGFPDEFIVDAVSDTQAYRQLGNSVPVPMIEAVAKAALKAAGILT